MSSVTGVPWKREKKPRRILVMRFQAMGDVVITLPYLQDLKNKLPGAEFDFITRQGDSAIPRSLLLFDRIYGIRGGRNLKLQLVHMLFLMPVLWLRRYDIVIDLQNHKISRLVRRLVAPVSWCEFDRSSPQLAGERTKRAIDSLHLPPVSIEPRFSFRFSTDHVNAKLISAGWVAQKKIIVLNPAGAFATRNWELQNYVTFAGLWLKDDPDCQFLILGLPSLKNKADFFKSALGPALIDLVGETTPEEAFRLVGNAAFTLTEDGGLMHMSWVQGIPTLALFGSTRSDWSSPHGPWSRCLNSSDLPCGNCMLEVCKFGDTRCLQRYSPQDVLTEAKKLLAQVRS